MSAQLRDDLEIKEDLTFQRIEWGIQRAGWILFALILTAACAGVFGRGWIGTAIAGSEGASVSVEHYRFWRVHAPMTLRLHVAPHAVRDGELRLWLGRSYLENVRIRSMVPEPDHVEAAADRFTYVFPAPALTAATAISLELEVERAGWVRGEAGLEHGSRIEFSHFVFP